MRVEVESQVPLGIQPEPRTIRMRLVGDIRLYHKFTVVKYFQVSFVEIPSRIHVISYKKRVKAGGKGRVIFYLTEKHYRAARSYHFPFACSSSIHPSFEEGAVVFNRIPLAVSSDINSGVHH